MMYVRVKSYYPDGQFTSCEHLYLGTDHEKARERFLSEYPEHKDCILRFSLVDSEQDKDYFRACLECGCVH